MKPVRAALMHGVMYCLGACATLPPAPEKDLQVALDPATDGVLANVAAEVSKNLESDGSATLLVPASDQALHWRLAMVDNATRSIDAQYFIWKDDACGTLLLEHVFAAADRGVRVRLLVDDMFLSTGGAFEGADRALAGIDYHPNIELRVFNPGRYRSGIMGLAGNFGVDLRAYNRRMHNKLLIADNHLAILGGRNIGNEYFGLYEPYNFLDLDVLVSGAAVGEASRAFDAYWNSDLAYPAAALHPADQDGYERVRAENRQFASDSRDVLTAYTGGSQARADQLVTLPKSMRAGYAVFLQDEPVQHGDREYRLYDMLSGLVAEGDTELIVSAPYLLPVGDFLAHIEENVAAGIRTQLITNSLATNDATAAHSHYKKYRRQILERGAELYELLQNPKGGMRELSDVPPQRGEVVGLHIKAASTDGGHCFVGSLNMDPRSIVLNTENGLYIESNKLCDELHDLLARIRDPDNAWQVTLNEKGDLQWQSHEGLVDRQPARGVGQRVADFFYRLLPLESQL